MIKDADTNDTSGQDGLTLPGGLVGESQLRIPKLEPYIIFSIRAPLVSVELEYHASAVHLSLPVLWYPSSSSDCPWKEGKLCAAVMVNASK